MSDRRAHALVFFGATGDLGANVIAPGQEKRSQTAEMLGTQLPRADEMDAYARVLGDAMQGDATLFARCEGLP